MILEKLLWPDRFLAFRRREVVNCIRDPAKMKIRMVGMIPRVLKTKGRERMPTPITVFMRIVTDRKMPASGWRYLS
jgi:hypothetical protein